MTIDFKLIEKSIGHSLSSLESSELVVPGLLYINNFLDPELLIKLQNYIVNDELTWDIQEHQNNIGRSYKRKKINWVSDSVIEETHSMLDKLTDYINQRFNRQNKFLGLSIWKDEFGYQLKPHTDNPVIDIAVQIYLNGDDSMDLGTRFQVNTLVKIPYKTNHGYLMDNRQNIKHFYNGKFPKDYHRYSLYAIWTNANK